MTTKTAKRDNPPNAIRLDLSIGVNEETWKMLQHNHMSEDEIEQHFISDVEAAISRYTGYHNLIGLGGVVDIQVTKFY